MHVLHLRHCAIKGTRHVDHEAIEVTASGVRGDRRFALVDPADHRVLPTVQHPRLTLAVADLRVGELRVRLPDGTEAAQRLAPAGPPVPVAYWERSITAVLRPGPVSDALTGHLRRPAVLAEAAGEERFLYSRPVGIWFTGELLALSRRVGADLDPRRFRLAIGIEGSPPEDPVGCTVTVGDAVLRVEQPVTRCPIVDWGVDTATADLDLLARLRAGGAEPVFGYGCTVLRPGGVRAGDTASLGFQP